VEFGGGDKSVGKIQGNSKNRESGRLKNIPRQTTITNQKLMECNQSAKEGSEMPRMPDFGFSPWISPTIYRGSFHRFTPLLLQHHDTNKNAKMNTEVAIVTGKLIKRSQGLRERYQSELGKLNGPEKYALAIEVARLMQKQQEQISFATQVQKEVIETWTDADYADMGVDRTTADTELSFTTTLLPLADLHTKTKKRKARAKERLEATWGENWEYEVRDLMPPWLAEEFHRGLAVFSKKHVDWAVLKTILQDRIQQRLAVKKTRKVTWLMARDISTTYKEKPVVGQQEEEEAECGPTGQVEGEPSLATAPPSTASERTAEGTQSSEAEAVGGHGPIPHESSAVPPRIAEDGSGAGADLASGAVIEDAGSERVDDGRAKEVEAGVA